jgi:signal transduction histidine kinase
MLGSIDFALLTVGVAVASIGVLGFTVFWSDTKSATNRAFFYFSLVSVAWTIANYAQYNTGSITLSFWLVKLVIFIAVWHAFTFFRLLYIFPETKKDLPSRFYVWGVPVVSFVALATLSPLVFRSVKTIENGKIASIENGPLIALFAGTVTVLIVSAIVVFMKRRHRAKDLERKQLTDVLFGFVLTFILLLTLNLFLPAFFGNAKFIPLGGLYLLPFVAFTSFSIYRNRLFNVKVAVTSGLVFILCTAIFFESVFSKDLFTILLKVIEFALVLGSGVLLIKSVQKEVEAREEIRKLADELAETNVQLEVSNERLRIMDQRKSEFVSIASHQLRTPVTAMKGYSSLLLEDAYGKLPDAAREPVNRIFESTQRLVNMINDFLNISKIEQGTMEYHFAPLDLAKMVRELVDDFHVTAGKKNIDLAVMIPENERFAVVADEGKIRQILSNLIDNSIKYTPQGSVRVILEKEPEKGPGMIHLMIRDTGIGLSQDDIHHLFGKFTRGSEGSKVNTSGSGLGLYVAKQMMEKHSGNIWVDSEGKGKGSTFSIELPEWKGELPK